MHHQLHGGSDLLHLFERYDGAQQFKNGSCDPGQSILGLVIPRLMLHMDYLSTKFEDYNHSGDMKLDLLT